MAELPVTRDGFNGVTCDLGSIGLEAPDVVAFGARVDSNIERWRADGVRGVWMRVPVGLLELAPALRDRGFSLHHSGDGYLMLTRWLPDPALDPNLLPRYATHFVGVGSLCLRRRPAPGRDGRELLVVVERYGLDDKQRWKLPGGAVDAGERISTAAERELREETGVEATFHSILSVRHAQRFSFGRSDLYFVCLMDVSADPSRQEPHPDPHEIAAARWMPVEEYLANPDVTPFAKTILATALVHDARSRPTIALDRFTFSYGPTRSFTVDWIGVESPSTPELAALEGTAWDHLLGGPDHPRGSSSSSGVSSTALSRPCPSSRAVGNLHAPEVLLLLRQAGVAEDALLTPEVRAEAKASLEREDREVARSRWTALACVAGFAGLALAHVLRVRH